MKRIIALFLVSLLAMTGCADMNNGGVSKQGVGAVTGGVLGGLLGTQVHGKGRAAAMIGGTLLGAFVGSSIGQSMDEVDRMKMSQTLETAPSNATQTWVNPDSHVSYQVTPTRTYQQDGRPCREYTTRANIGGRMQSVYGTACRTSDGSWQVVSQ